MAPGLRYGSVSGFGSIVRPVAGVVNEYHHAA
jgi:hypothetical protein